MLPCACAHSAVSDTCAALFEPVEEKVQPCWFSELKIERISCLHVKYVRSNWSQGMVLPLPGDCMVHQPLLQAISNNDRAADVFRVLMLIN